MLRRLATAQPESFAFTDANQRWAEAQITKYPPGRQASAIIPLLWRAQEQEGWLSRPAIEHVAAMLDMAYIRALEVATFYFMFQLQPVGSVAHVQVCGTTSCMIMGAEDLVDVCKQKIAKRAHALSEDGKFSWEEVECLGACSNAPMVQIGKDYYEDLTPENFSALLDRLAAGELPRPGPQAGRFASEPAMGLTSLEGEAVHETNASVGLAEQYSDGIKKIDGTEQPLIAPWAGAPEGLTRAEEAEAHKHARAAAAPDSVAEAREKSAGWPAEGAVAEAAEAEGAADSKEASDTEAAASPDGGAAANAPESTAPGFEGAVAPGALETPREGGADDLKRIDGVGPKIEGQLNGLGIYHFDQIAAWGPDDLARIDALLSFKGRAERYDWVGQAKRLAKGDDT